MSSHDGEPLPILTRTYSTEFASDADGSVGKSAKGSGRKVPPIPPADIHLVFDTETTLDPAMRCRLGFYQLYQDGELLDECLLYDPCEAFAGDTDTIHAYAKARGLSPPVTLDQFRALLRKVMKAGGQIVGFNLPFDLSRIAIDSAPAKPTKWNRKMQGAHSLKLWDSPYHPRIQIKHINPRLSLHSATVPSQGKARSARKRRDNIPADRGTFIDVRTSASAILSGGYSLERLTTTLQTPTRKLGTEQHGQPLTFDYLDYARADVQATWECFCALRTRYEGFGLATPFHNIRSEAGLGKAMLTEMDITICADNDPAKTARSLHSYYGGRTEVRIRRQPVRIVLTDFMSMYPTVCTLMGLWRFVIASEVIERDATEEARALLATACPQDWQGQSAWRALPMLVKVQCDRDMFPVRSYYQGEQHASIGLNFLTTQEPQWFTLADCLAAKFQTGKVPDIVEAVAFAPGKPQPGLQPMTLLGRLKIDPYRDDPFRELIVMRDLEAKRRDTLPEAGRAAVEEFRQLLKIIANSASYGIFLQLNITDEERKVRRHVHVHGREPFEALLSKSEEPGPCFHPLLGTLITGAARLMLTLAQERATQEGLGWAFCDTDSLALAMPDGMNDTDFLARTERVSQWFASLNPYGSAGSILKEEDVNFVPGSKTHRPLYCYAIASKRYALFNLDGEGRPIIRKASAHGLGHLAAPYGDDDDASGFPPPLPEIRTGKDRLARWQHDIWYAILRHELAGEPGNVRFDYHPALLGPAMSQFSATSPATLRWTDAINEGLDYPDRVKPFGLLYCLHAKKPMPDFAGAGALGLNDPKAIHPIAPFHPDRAVAIDYAFDRITGKPVSADRVMTYADMLKSYPYRQESKFRYGEAFDRGLTEPRHVIATETHYIGKEADRWEEDFLIGTGFDPMTLFGRNPDDATATFEAIREAARIHGQKPVSDATGLARGSIRRICEGKSVRTKLPHGAIMAGLQSLAGRRKPV
ncbi:MAG: hypothetical protein J7498_11205 [Sphingobium sp.]|nr:hypothetical protein [Sphingobium sp.]